MLTGMLSDGAIELAIGCGCWPGLPAGLAATWHRDTGERWIRIRYVIAGSLPTFLRRVRPWLSAICHTRQISLREWRAAPVLLTGELGAGKTTLTKGIAMSGRGAGRGNNQSTGSQIHRAKS